MPCVRIIYKFLHNHVSRFIKKDNLTSLRTQNINLQLRQPLDINKRSQI